MTRYRISILMSLSIVTFLFLLAFASCGKSNNSGITPGFVPRYANLVARVVENGSVNERVRGFVIIEGPLELGLIVSYGIHRLPPGGGKIVTKREIDFGDGIGWVDVTAESVKWSDGGVGGEPTPDQMTRRVYTEPGEYLIRGRVTYWDGEVYDTSGIPEDFIQSTDLLVRILPPEEAAE